MLPKNIRIEGRDELLNGVPIRVIEVDYHSLTEAIELLNACDPFIHQMPVWKNHIWLMALLNEASVRRSA